MTNVPFGWFGKHPAFGDFVARGVSEPVRVALQDWLDGALGLWRAEAGEAWREAFDAAPTVRFWIGGMVLGQGRSGVLAPSHDKVGRRYPLVLLTAGTALPPPLAPEQDTFDTLEAKLADVIADAGTAVPGDGIPDPVDDILWATNETAQAATLLSDIAAEDMCRAAQTRSYWWTTGEGARVISVTGLPDGATLAWLMTGASLRRPEEDTMGDPDAC